MSKNIGLHLLKPSTKPKEDGPYPICKVGEQLCNRPDYELQIFTEYCQHCRGDCHEGCGDFLDVPRKVWDTEPGWYCIKCIACLPKDLYPKIPNNGNPRNIPKREQDGNAFDMFMTQRLEMIEKKNALTSSKKKKQTTKIKQCVVVNTRSQAARPRRSSRFAKLRY